MRGAITNDFIAVTLDGGLRVPFRGSRAGEIRGMTGRIPLFAWEEAFPLEKNSGYPSPERHVPRANRSIGGRPPDVSIFNRPHDTLRLNVHARTPSRFEIGERIEFRSGIEIFYVPIRLELVIIFIHRPPVPSIEVIFRLGPSDKTGGREKYGLSLASGKHC